MTRLISAARQRVVRSSSWSIARALSCVTAAALLVPAGAEAGGVETWSASDRAGFERGTLEGSALDAEGRIVLAPTLETLWGPDEGIVWDVVPAAAGAAFVALSGPARVLRIGPEVDTELWFEGDEELLVTALASDGAGGFYVGTSPDGKVTHTDVDGVVEVVMETEARFVWGLAVAEDGALWAGTGVPGRVLRRTDAGDTSTVFETAEDPVRCLTVTHDRTIVAGTGGRGRVVRFDEAGRPFVLLDAEEAEIVALAADPDGTLFALASGGARQLRRSDPDTQPRTSDNTVRVTATPPSDPNGAPGEPPEPSSPPQERPTRHVSGPGGGALYRIDADGTTRVIWQTAGEIPFDLVRIPDGTLLASTGDGGRIHQLDRDGRASRLLRIASDQASAMSVGPDGGVFVGGTGDARLELLGPESRREGSYVSPAIDAGTAAEWGRVRWEAQVPRGARVAAHVRAGNTAEPDETWTDWVAIEPRNGEGSAADLPVARWAQVRADLERGRDGSPLVSELELFYLPRNRAPRIDSLAYEPAGIVWTKGPVQSSALTGPVAADDPVARSAARNLVRARRPPIRRSYELGARTFTWDAEDVDGDRLTYRLEIQRQGSADWVTLAAEIPDSFFSWDARSMPDGQYRVRLIADDFRDNPEGLGLSDRRLGELFRIDNTRPAVRAFDVVRVDDTLRVQFEATDLGGTIAAVEFALDGGAWLPIDPVDGIADSEVERYRLDVEVSGDPTPSRSLRVRVSDTVGNLGGDLWLLDE